MKDKLKQLKNWFKRFSLVGQSRHTKNDFVLAVVPTFGITIDEFEIEFQILWAVWAGGIIYDRR